VQQHSGASRVKLSLSAARGQLSFDVTDNGRGFDIDSSQLYSFVKKGRLGLASMKERVELAGGRLTIASSDKGTCLSIVIPAPGVKTAPVGEKEND
jgi:signal transduction histidine kinase